MRDSLSCSVELRRFDVWRWGFVIVTLVAVAAVAGWIAYGQESVPVEARVTVAALTALLVAWAAGLWRVTPGVLALRSGQWQFTPFSGGSGPEDVKLHVAIDLGTFMLFTLRRDPASRPSARQWLPAQRRGLESSWHALRCAAYAPQRGSEMP